MALFLLIVYATGGLPIAAILIGLVAVPIIFGFGVTAIADSIKEKRRLKARRIAARKIARQESIRRRFESQLKKPDFDTRLNDFLSSKKPESEPFTIPRKMRFWQRSSKYELTPTRPVELMRTLLHRISKIVSGGQKR